MLIINIYEKIYSFGAGLFDLEHLLLLRVSCLQSNHQATAKINKYKQRYRKLGTCLQRSFNISGSV